MRLGATVSIYVTEQNKLSDVPTGRTLKGRAVAVLKEDRDVFTIGWKDQSDAPYGHATEIDYDDSDNDLSSSDYKFVRNHDDYNAFVLSEEALLVSESNPMKKVLEHLQSDTIDATWRQSVERVIGIGHKHLAKQATTLLDPTKAKMVASFFASDHGRHILAYVLGLAIEAIPNQEDPRLERLAKELRIYGLEVFVGGALKYAEGFFKEVTKVLPSLPKASA